jgi:hypothetical protein
LSDGKGKRFDAANQGTTPVVGSMRRHSKSVITKSHSWAIVYIGTGISAQIKVFSSIHVLIGSVVHDEFHRIDAIAARKGSYAKILWAGYTESVEIYCISIFELGNLSVCACMNDIESCE